MVKCSSPGYQDRSRFGQAGPLSSGNRDHPGSGKRDHGNRRVKHTLGKRPVDPSGHAPRGRDGIPLFLGSEYGATRTAARWPRCCSSTARFDLGRHRAEAKGAGEGSRGLDGAAVKSVLGRTPSPCPG